MRIFFRILWIILGVALLGVLFLWLGYRYFKPKEEAIKYDWVMESDFQSLTKDSKAWMNVKTLKEIPMLKPQTNLDKKEASDTAQTILKKVCFIYKHQPYSVGLDTLLPSFLCHKNLEITVSSLIKMSGNTSASLVFNILKGDSSVYWLGKPFQKPNNETSEWFTHSETVLVPRNFILPNTRFKCYFSNTSDKDTLMLSNFKVSVRELPLKSYIPPVDFPDIKEKEQLIFKNQFVKIKQTTSGLLNFYNNKDSLIINGLAYYFEYNYSKNYLLKWIETFFKKDLKKNKQEFIKENDVSYAVKVVNSSDNTLDLRVENSKAELNIRLKMNEDLSKIEWQTNTVYKTDVSVFREALVFRATPKIASVYLKNGEVDNRLLEPEYWLEKQGLKIGKSETSVYFLPASQISSYQVETEKNFVFVNLDYALDHPLIYFPIKEEDQNYFINISNHTFKEGEQSQHQFSTQMGLNHDFYPRKMRSRNGFLSSYIFSEHADYTDIRLHRAVYFGRSDISKADSAVGGFVKHNIPVTKSVFYNNLDTLMNDDKRYGTNFGSPIASIKNTEGMFHFLKEIERYGSEICLHTPEQFCTNKRNLKEALEFTRKHFNSRNWIDHGYNNAPHRNREDLVCDALNPESDFYALPLYQENGLKYFWAPYYEDACPFLGLNLYPYIKRPYEGFGERFPLPEYWQHKTKAPNAYFWKTTAATDLGNWNTYFSETILNDFINHYSFEINHVYPARINKDADFWKAEGENYVISPEFNRFLSRLSKYQSEKKIECTTVSEMIDYWTQCDSLSFEAVKRNTFKIQNLSTRPLKGVTYMCEADSVNINVPYESRKHGKHLIFNLDLMPQEEAVITFHQ